jgi:phospholipid transport system substrate-binding protein
MMMRRILLGLFGLAMAMAPLQATAQGDAEAQPIAMLNAGLLQVMAAGRGAPFATRMATLTPIIEKSFDLPLLLQNSVGPARWSSISKAQKAELLDVFTQFTVASYVANFDAANGEKFVIAPEKRLSGKDTVVQTRIIGSGGDTTKLDYVMREISGTWKVVDVLLDGTISRVAVTRSDFRALLATPDAAPLIASLRGKVSNLAAENAS